MDNDICNLGMMVLASLMHLTDQEDSATTFRLFGNQKLCMPRFTLYLLIISMIAINCGGCNQVQSGIIKLSGRFLVCSKNEFDLDRSGLKSMHCPVVLTAQFIGWSLNMVERRTSENFVLRAC